MKQEETTKATEEQNPKTADTPATDTKAKSKASSAKKTSAPKKKTPPPANADIPTPKDENPTENTEKELSADLPDHAPTEEEETEHLLDGMSEEETAKKSEEAQKTDPEANADNKNQQEDDADDEKKGGLFFKKKKKKKEQVDPLAGIERFKADSEKGLTKEQVDTRVSQGLVNSTPKKYSKTYKSIFFSNICTFFNYRFCHYNAVFNCSTFFYNYTTC